MNHLSELFWSTSLTELKRGYIYKPDTEEFVCIVCGERLEKGMIYTDETRLYEAEKFMHLHITKQHGSMFHYLLSLDKNVTGLTDHQKKLLSYFAQGLSDSDIVKKLEGGSKSTIRNHRFTLREKKKQAKVFLAIMELLEDENVQKDPFIPIHQTAKMVDERYAITEEENTEFLKTYFKQGLDGPLSSFPKKEKRKIAILRHISNRFEVNRTYSEKEVNEVLKNVFADFVTLRRYLIEYGFLDRSRDGSFYWVKR